MRVRLPYFPDHQTNAKLRLKSLIDPSQVRAFVTRPASLGQSLNAAPSRDPPGVEANKVEIGFAALVGARMLGIQHSELMMKQELVHVHVGLPILSERGACRGSNFSLPCRCMSDLGKGRASPPLSAETVPVPLSLSQLWIWPKSVMANSFKVSAGNQVQPQLQLEDGTEGNDIS